LDGMKPKTARESCCRGEQQTRRERDHSSQI